MKKRQFSCILILLSFWTNSIHAQINQSNWTFNIESFNKIVDFEKTHTAYKQVQINIENFKAKLKSSVQEIEIPTPEGTFETYEIRPVQVVADEVKHLYTIKTFRGIKKGEPSTLIACDISDNGFHAAIYAGKASYYVQPIDPNKPTHLAVFYNHDRLSKTICHVKSALKESVTNQITTSASPNEKRTYRLAIAASSAYCESFGGTPYRDTNVLNALVTGVNFMNPVFLRDVGVEFTVVSNEDLLFPEYNDDPFDFYDQDEASDLCHEICVEVLGVEGFDIGHVVDTQEEGGIASLGVVCYDDEKGIGLSSGADDLVGLWIDFVAHEIGHQLGTDHNFSSRECENSTDGLRFEPGEGSSIMCYVGVCGDGVSPATATVPYFHYNSILQMRDVIEETSCGEFAASGNASTPTADAKADITIPQNTPFVLIGDASDANDASENLTYNWHQWNGDGGETRGNPDCEELAEPLFEYFEPTTEKHRSFPLYSEVLKGENDQEWEQLPCTTGSLDFSLAVRDNNANFGRFTQDLMRVNVADSGPFEVRLPNGNETLGGGSLTEIRWTVNNTNTHCPRVDILLSTDAGETFTVIGDATNNDGSALLSLPNTPSSTARILVRCDVDGGFRAASTFYDVSDGNFTIEEGTTSTYEIADTRLSIFPNPVSDRIFIETNKVENFAFRLVNLRGCILKTGTLDASNGISVSGFPTGLYYLQVIHQASGKSIVEKVVVE